MTVPFSRPRAVLWDNDGVLVDTEPVYFEACRQTLAEAGVRLAPERFRSLSLERGQSVLTLACPPDAPAGMLERLRRKRAERYSELLRGGVRVREGIREMLDLLKGRVRMAVVTSSLREHFLQIHAHTGFLRFMEVFVTREDTVHTKPHPAPYREALRRMNLFPGECLAVEDSPRGLASARSAGVPCAVIPTSLTRAGNFEGACRVLTSAHELVSQVPSPSPPRASATPRASGSPSKERSSRPCPNPKAT